MRVVRLLLWTLSAAGAVAVGVLLATGRWDPAGLRLVTELSVGGVPDAELGEAEGSFRAEQYALDGEVLWRLRGERMRRGQDGLTHVLEQPLLELFRERSLWLRVSGAQARVRLPSLGDEGGDPAEGEGAEEEGEGEWLQLSLEGEVVLEGAGARLEGDDLTVWAQRRGGELDPSSVRLRAEEPLRATVETPGGTWSIFATGLEARADTQTARFEGPVRVVSSPLRQPAAVRGSVWRGRLRWLTLQGQAAAPHPALTGDLEPGAVEARGEALDVTAGGPASGALRSQRVRLLAVRRPLGAHVVQGGLGGALPAWGWSVAEADFTGEVRAEVERPQVPSAAALALGGVAGVGQAPVGPAVELALEADAVRYEAAGQALTATGAPARLRERRNDAYLAAPRLRAAQAGDLWRVAAGEGPVDFAFAEPVPRPDGPPDERVRWTGRAAELEVDLARELPGAAAEASAAEASAAEASAAEASAAEASAAEASAAEASAAEASAADLGGLGRVRRFTSERLDARAEGAPGLLRAESLRYVATGTRGDLQATQLEALAPALERGRHAAPWRLTGERVEAALDLDALAADAPRWHDVVLAADVRQPGAQRAGGDEPRRRRTLDGARLRWDGEVAHLGGAPAEVTLGEVGFAAGSARYDPRSGRLVLEEGVRARLERRPRGRAGEPPPPLEVYVLTGARAEATVLEDPEVWERDQDRRREARRAGRGEWQSVFEPLPEAITALTVEGDARQRVEGVGPDALQVRADRLDFARDGAWAALTSAPGGPPVELSHARGSASARRVRVERADGVAGPALRLALEGDVAFTGRDERGEVEGRAEQAEVELLPPEPPRDADGANPGADLGADLDADVDAREPRLGAFALSGPKGVELRVRRAAPPGGGAPLRAAVEAGRVTGRGEGEDVLFELTDRWRATLVRADGAPARVSAAWARGRLDASVLQAGARPGEPPEGLVRRGLKRFEAGDGFELTGEGVAARGERIVLDGSSGTYTLRGDPAWIRRQGLESRGARLELRFGD